LYIDVLREYVWAMRQRGELGEAQAACVKLYAELKQVISPFVAQFGEYECAVTTLERGDIVAAESGFARAKELATKANLSTGLAMVEVQLARIDMSQRNWAAARDHLLRAIEKYAGEERAGYEADAQALLALNAQALSHIDERDRAAARARELSSRVTTRQKVLVAEIILAQLDGKTSALDSALLNLQRLADEAAKRHWLLDALYARLAMVELLADARAPRATLMHAALKADDAFASALSELAGLQTLAMLLLEVADLFQSKLHVKGCGFLKFEFLLKWNTDATMAAGGFGKSIGCIQ
jgi:hypothetical protein